MRQRLPTDPNGVALVRGYITSALAKSYDEQVAFNEGVMCAAFGLGAFIDGMPSGTPPEARRVVEEAFETLKGQRIQIKLLPPKEGVTSSDSGSRAERQDAGERLGPEDGRAAAPAASPRCPIASDNSAKSLKD